MEKLLEYAMQIAHERELRVGGHAHDEEGAVRRFQSAVERLGQAREDARPVAPTKGPLLRDPVRWDERNSDKLPRPELVFMIDGIPAPDQDRARQMFLAACAATPQPAAQAAPAVRLIVEALEASTPTMNHYAEPVERHVKALEAARAILNPKGDTNGG